MVWLNVACSAEMGLVSTQDDSAERVWGRGKRRPTNVSEGHVLGEEAHDFLHVSLDINVHHSLIPTLEEPFDVSRSHFAQSRPRSFRSVGRSWRV